MTIHRVELIQPRIIGIRPHHLLCLNGYKGHAYTSNHKTIWDAISQALERNPDFEVVILKNKDALCAGCPGSVDNTVRCKEQFVSHLDRQVQNLLGLAAHKTYRYQKIMDKLFRIMTPQKHEELCVNCGWWKEGFCRDTFNGK